MSAGDVVSKQLNMSLLLKGLRAVKVTQLSPFNTRQNYLVSVLNKFIVWDGGGGGGGKKNKIFWQGNDLFMYTIFC